MKRLHSIWLASAGLASMGLGCATGPLATTEIARAQSALDQAESRGGAEHAPLEMRNAREKLDTADRLAEEGAGLDASRAAEKAEVDALLAVEKARRARAQQSIDELDKTIDAMEEEMTHDDVL